ncbi:L-piperidine-6-carboxylate dehydrogenase [Desulfopila inferna]|uniref:L-piperidine-6-carboxylate dehydrogenase n=1 Tax=Desulfopila inferna TaxID=468528 RepID=UPI001965A7EC|nr:aldehyde dehydrogenase family protein [Desulfopila inferna]MBM9603616.1 aldehyde dehydrogenase family protein [Desulfopila inferna]
MKFLDDLAIGGKNSGVSSGGEWGKTVDNGEIEVMSPVDGKIIASVYQASPQDFTRTMEKAAAAFHQWRITPAPKRGEIVRQIGDEFRRHKTSLGTLVSYEMGKSLQEGLGEVQEMIDICDFAVGQSRQLYGFTMHSERDEHRLYDQYHPLGVVGVISAFNFPAAVWSWNAMISAVCGNTVIWKPSSKTPLTAIAIHRIVTRVTSANRLPEGIFNIVVGRGSDIGERMLQEKRIALLSVTGSTGVGRHAAQVVASRLGKCILELGGNNAIIVTENADLKLAVPALVFSAVGTAGQRCTTTRRVIIHDSVYDRIKEALIRAYSTLKIGSPLREGVHMGPLIDIDAVEGYQKALRDLVDQGGSILFGGNVLRGDEYASGCYVEPVLAEAENSYPIVQDETFAPILYLIRYSGGVENGIALQNEVVQGLSSSIFTGNLREAELFLSAQGSDCGIANVNIGTSGAEIGGAFGGEKETGGGRESGSDAWKGYMRRQTNTINYGKTMPLAQGIKFDI